MARILAVAGEQPEARPPAWPGRGDPLLEVTGLAADYGVGSQAVHAVRDADLVLRRGEVLGLAGESGSGKSATTATAGTLWTCSRPASGSSGCSAGRRSPW